MSVATSRRDQVVAIYDRSYVEFYELLYLQPWSEKHRLNVKNIMHLSQELHRRPIRWLDTCCGQAWLFSQFADGFKKTGIDISPAQLEAGRKRNRDATFIRADVAEVAFRPALYGACLYGAYMVPDA